jgi:hypothetical protein
MGPMIRARGVPGRYFSPGGRRFKCVRIVIRKAAILPVPVCALPVTSMPARASSNIAAGNQDRFLDHCRSIFEIVGRKSGTSNSETPYLRVNWHPSSSILSECT